MIRKKVFSGVAVLWQTLDELINNFASLGITYTPTADELNDATNIQDMKDRYVASTNRLQEIIDFAGTPTLAILGTAIKDIARILLLLLKLLRRQYNGL